METERSQSVGTGRRRSVQTERIRSVGTDGSRSVEHHYTIYGARHYMRMRIPSIYLSRPYVVQLRMR